MRKTTAFLPVVLLVSAGLTLGACSGGDDDDAGPAEVEETAAEADVRIETFQFQPNPAEAAAGTVTITNLDNTTHTFTNGTPDAPGDAWEGLRLEGPDATGTVELDAGTYEFFCEIHTSMTGAITVT
jgi:plastocyanin